jgi:DNA polymerase-3 subunit delta'
LQHPDIRLIFALPTGKNEGAGDDPLQVLEDEQIAEVREELARKARDPYSRISLTKANFIKINSIRAIRREAALTNVESRRKVFIVLDADMMKDEAANALLKTLEEPPQNTVFILTTARKERLPSTIVSRCQMVAFPLLKEEEIAAALMAREGAGEGEALLAARLGNGSYTAAREMLSDDTREIRAATVQYLRRVLGRQRIPLAQEIERIVTGLDRPAAERWLRSLQVWLRDALLMVTTEGEMTSHILQQEELKSFITKFPNADLVAASAAVEDCIALVGKNVYLPLIFTNLALRLRSHLQGSPATP